MINLLERGVFMKILVIILVVLLLVGGLLSLGMAYFFRPISKVESVEIIKNRLDRFVEKYDLDYTLLRLYSDKIDFNESFTSGSLEGLNDDSRYHSASIGKTFTTALMFKLQSHNLLNLDDLIVDYLDDDLLEDLFVIDSEDFRDQVTIKMLLNHTSGVGDYFEGSVSSGKSFIEIMIDQPDKFYLPIELVDFTRVNQQAYFKPGEGFHYSDTGYILAGMIIEKVTARPFHEVLHQEIIDPLGLEHTNLTHYSEAKIDPDEMLPIYINDVDFSHTNALSIDWSGGGLTTTSSDLLKFYQALQKGQIISKDDLKEMTTFSHQYDKGIEYGIGLMNFNLPELSPLLKSMPNLYGGVGSTASYMLYDESNDLYIIMNVGSFDMVEKSVQELVQILMVYNRIDLEK